MSVTFEPFFQKFTMQLKGSLSHEIEMGADPLGNLQRLNNMLEAMPVKLATVEQTLSNTEHQLETAKMEVTKPFAQEQELKEKLERLSELNTLLNMDEKGDEAVSMEDEPESGSQEKKEDTEISSSLTDDDSVKPVIAGSVSERIAGIQRERERADRPGGRISVREKLAEMNARIGRERAGGLKQQDNSEIGRSKGKEAIL